MHVRVEAVGEGHVRRVLCGVFGEDEGCAGIGGIDVYPNVGVLFEDGCERGEVVDGAGGGCAEGERDVVGFEALASAFFEGGGEGRASEGEVVGEGGWDRAEACACYTGALGCGGVGLVRGEGDEFPSQLGDAVVPFCRVGLEAFRGAFAV